MLPFSHPSQRSRYRSARSVRPNGVGPAATKKWSRSKVIFLTGSLVVVAALMTVPIMLLEGTEKFQRSNSASHQHPNNLLHISNAIQQQAAGSVLPNAKDRVEPDQKKVAIASDTSSKSSSSNNNNNIKQPLLFDTMEQQSDKKEAISDNDGDQEPASPLARGVNKLPLSRTPALIGASRGHIQCDVPVDEERLVYWSAPQGDRDQRGRVGAHRGLPRTRAVRTLR